MRHDDWSIVCRLTVMEGRKPRVLLGLSGSVACVKVPEIASRLHEFAEVKIVMTTPSLHFFERSNDYNAIMWERFNKLNPEVAVLTDKDEWGAWNVVGDPVLHVQLRSWADILVIAPLSANTLGKMANGLCDNLLTCIVRAWDVSKPLLVAPAMNTHMWDHPLTQQHLGGLRQQGVVVIEPVVKTLACKDTGKGALAPPEHIVEIVREALSTPSCVFSFDNNSGSGVEAVSSIHPAQKTESRLSELSAGTDGAPMG